MRFIPVIALLHAATMCAQLPVTKDTITVFENGRVLKMPWGNGLNYSNVSNCDLNGDGRKDLVLYDKLNQYSAGSFRCFLHSGTAGSASFRANTNLPYFFPKVVNWGVMADYNCDGKEDLFCSSGSGIKVYRNTSLNGVPSFALMSGQLLSDYNPGGNPYIVNIYASPVAVPGIADIDNDGDLDILSFSSQGVFIEYHRNMSKEKYGHCDSLVFEMHDYCWGKLSESNCQVNLNDCGPKHGKVRSALHAGSCLTCFDSDGDNDMDLLMGDISCSTMHYAHNAGTTTAPDFMDTTQLYPNFPAKGNTTTIRMNYFPCGYAVDGNGDGKKDLVVSPSNYGSDNFNSLWYYENVSATSTVNFQFIKNNFLQDEMIETGLNAFPLLLDYNADGRKDLLIGNYGYYNNGTLSARLTLYQNTGTAAQPVFSLVTRDYAGLSAKNLPYAIPALGDPDSDGDTDILIGTFSGQIHWLENTGGSGNACNFSVFKNNPFNITTLSSVAAPFMFDLDSDGLQDIITGTKNGRLAWYRNIGTASVPAFTVMTNTLGGVDVKGNINLYSIDGYAVPFFFKENNVTHLLVGSVSGDIFHYTVQSPGSDFTLLTKTANGINEGGQAAAWYEDINNDGKRDLFVGNAGGGLSFFTSNSPFVGIPEQNNFQPKIYPNPSSTHVTVAFPGHGEFTVDLIDITGNLLLQVEVAGQSAELGAEALQEGLYFCRVTSRDGSTSLQKLIIVR
jgi:hypothetical protein